MGIFYMAFVREKTLFHNCFALQIFSVAHIRVKHLDQKQIQAYRTESFKAIRRATTPWTDWIDDYFKHEFLDILTSTQTYRYQTPQDHLRPPKGLNIWPETTRWWPSVFPRLSSSLSSSSYCCSCTSASSVPVSAASSSFCLCLRRFFLRRLLSLLFPVFTV